MTETSNPFAKMMVSITPERFYGRRIDIEPILQGVSAREPRSFSLYGARMIGKTTLLKYLCDPRGATTRYASALVDHGPGLTKPLKFLYIDCYHIAQGTLLSTLHKQLLELPELQHLAGAALVAQAESSETTPQIRQALLDAFQALHDREMRLAICLDHFDKAFHSMTYEDDVFLRHLAIYQSFVIATEKSLPELKQDSRVTSPLLNILIFRNIALLTDAEARDLVQSPAREAGIPFQPAEIEFILQTAGRHPYLLTAVCEFLVNQRLRHPELGQFVRGDDQSSKQTRSSLMALPAAHQLFLFLWDQLDEIQRRALSKTAAGHTVDSGTEQSTLHALRERALISGAPQQGRYHVFSELFGEFVLSRRQGSLEDILGALPQIDRRLFEYLLARPGQVCTFDELRVQVWQDPDASKRSLESAVHRLRKAIEEAEGRQGNIIQNVRGKGYLYSPRAE